MTSLFTLFRHKHCTLPIALEIRNYLLHFSFLNTENAKNARDGILETLIYKLFYGSMLPFKISHYAPGYNAKDDSLRGGGSRGRMQGVRTPPPPEMTCGFLAVFCKKKKTMWFIGVEVEQETSAPPP